MIWSTGDEFAKRFLNNLEDVHRKSSAECCAECYADEQHENTDDRTDDHQLLKYIERMVL